jgi:hypothetical protein
LKKVYLWKKYTFEKSIPLKKVYLGFLTGKRGALSPLYIFGYYEFF